MKIFLRPYLSVPLLTLWFVLQLFSGIGSIANTSDTGGVAFMAHVGGFVAGFACELWFV